jgi:hypothetical protein
MGIGVINTDLNKKHAKGNRRKPVALTTFSRSILIIDGRSLCL